MKWISVNDRMPEDGQEVIIYSEGGKVEAGVYYSNEFGFDYYDVSIRDIIVNVTHWMPLPEPPKDAI
jgi:hypothetical protein